MNRSKVLVGIMLAMFMAAVEATVVATAMPSVIATLGGVSLYGWVGASYLLASTVTVPIYGKLSDLRGRKPVILFGIALFLVGSIASGAAGTTKLLIVARAVQGLGAGAIQSTAMTMVGDMYSLEERGKIQAWLGSVWAIAGALGPLLGGFFVDALSWRWVFWFNVPFGIASAAMMIVHMKEEHGKDTDKDAPAERLDWLGAVALSVVSVALLLLAEHRFVTVTAAVVVIGSIAFALYESRVKTPIIPFHLFTKAHIAASMMLSALVGAIMLGVLNYAPLYVQGVLGRSPSAAGSVVTPMLIGWPVASYMTGRVLKRVGFRLPVLVGASLILAGALILAVFVPRTTATWPWWVSTFILGFGMGTLILSITVSLQSSVTWRERGSITALAMFTRSMGMALSVGALGALITARLAAKIDPELVGALLSHGKSSVLAAGLSASVVSALAASFTPLLWTVFGLAVVNFCVALAYHPKT